MLQLRNLWNLITPLNRSCTASPVIDCHIRYLYHIISCFKVIRNEDHHDMLQIPEWSPWDECDLSTFAVCMLDSCAANCFVLHFHQLEWVTLPRILNPVRRKTILTIYAGFFHGLSNCMLCEINVPSQIISTDWSIYYFNLCMHCVHTIFLQNHSTLYTQNRSNAYNMLWCGYVFVFILVSL